MGDNHEHPNKYQITFYDADWNVVYKENLKSAQCRGSKTNGQRCRKRTCIGLEYCRDHLITEKHLQIKKSNIPDAGLGVFVRDPDRPPNAVVFQRDQLIMQYEGEAITAQEAHERYTSEETGQTITGAYAFKIDNNRVVDSATRRGTMSLANTTRGAQRQEYGPPNAKFSVNARAHTVSVKASRPLRNGEELYIAYGPSFKMPHEEGVHYSTKKYSTKW
jgi:hypothetical protein